MSRQSSTRNGPDLGSGRRGGPDCGCGGGDGGCCCCSSDYSGCCSWRTGRDCSGFGGGRDRGNWMERSGALGACGSCAGGLLVSLGED